MGRSLTTQHDDKIETKTYYDKRIFACLFYPKGHQNKNLLNLNSDAHTNARLRDTITNYGFRIDTNAYVVSNECRLSDLSHTIFRPVSIILLQSWSKSIKAQSIPNI
jgi:hypothetical protein